MEKIFFFKVANVKKKVRKNKKYVNNSVCVEHALELRVVGKKQEGETIP